MKRLVLLLLPALFILSACDQKLAKTPGQRSRDQLAQRQNQQPPPAPVTELGYRFEGRTGRGVACTTGTRNYQSKAQLCTNLLDPVINSDCAESDRLAKFQRECHPDFQPIESLSCKFAVYRGAVRSDGKGSFDPATAIQYGEFCAGRTRGGLVNRGTTFTKGHLVDDIHADLNLEFVPRSTAVPEKQSRFRLKIYRSEAGGTDRALMEDFEFLSGRKAVVNELANTLFQVAVSCENTWGCER